MSLSLLPYSLSHNDKKGEDKGRNLLLTTHTLSHTMIKKVEDKEGNLLLTTLLDTKRFSTI